MFINTKGIDCLTYYPLHANALIEGKLFINGKFVEEFKPLTLGSTVTFDCHPRIETVEDGLRLQFTISCQNTSHLVYWSVRNHITNVYFGVRFRHQGARIKIE